MLYSASNETVRSIVSGLSPNESDTILAIAGSGDQGLALAEKAKNVILVDNNPDQIEYVKERIEKLRKGDVKGFVEPLEGQNKRYFKQIGRMQRILQKLDSVRLCEADIFDMLDTEDFNKFYMSNSVSYNAAENEREKRMQKIADCTKPKDTVYLADGHKICELGDSNIYYYTSIMKRVMYFFRPIQDPKLEPFAMDRKATQKARIYESGVWNPLVVQRT